jgi:hypothetical protein
MAAESEGKVEVEVEGDQIEIEIENDAPPEDRNATPLRSDPADIPDDEIRQYSDNVKKRIQQLTHARHDERRTKEEAIREREAALAYAKQIADENTQLKAKLSSGETTLIKTMQIATEKELDEAKRKYKEAMYTGDADKIANAQEEFSKAVIKAEKVKQFKAPPQEQLQPTENTTYNQPAPQQVIDPKADRWKRQNPWFGQPGETGVDDEMTYFAMGLHKKLTREYGEQYAASDEYYERINARMKEKFPEYFGKQAEPETFRRPATVVAPASRSSPPKKIKLSASEASMAKRIGVPLEEYAKQMAKLRMEGKI